MCQGHFKTSLYEYKRSLEQMARCTIMMSILPNVHLYHDFNKIYNFLKLDKLDSKAKMEKFF